MTGVHVYLHCACSNIYSDRARSFFSSAQTLSVAVKRYEIRKSPAVCCTKKTLDLLFGSTVERLLDKTRSDEGVETKACGGNKSICQYTQDFSENACRRERDTFI